MTGKLVGINTAIFSRSGGSQGVGFAIPANMVKVVVASAKTGGKAVARPWLGAKLQAVTADIADSMGLKRPSGALIANVAPDSPAARASLKPGDLIVSVDGQDVEDPNAFDYRFATKALGGTARLGIVRGGREQAVTVALQIAPEMPREEIVIRSRSPFSGVKIANLSPALVDELQVRNAEEGVVVVDVDNGSYASNLGFQRGDVIQEVNGERIARTHDLERLSKTQNRAWRIVIVRNGQKISAVFGG
jgi:S1-C subfamily serine protease